MVVEKGEWEATALTWVCKDVMGIERRRPSVLALRNFAFTQASTSSLVLKNSDASTDQVPNQQKLRPKWYKPQNVACKYQFQKSF